jgi:hypothetical protein
MIGTIMESTERDARAFSSRESASSYQILRLRRHAYGTEIVRRVRLRRHPLRVQR